MLLLQIVQNAIAQELTFHIEKHSYIESGFSLRLCGKSTFLIFSQAPYLRRVYLGANCSAGSSQSLGSVSVTSVP